MKEKDKVSVHDVLAVTIQFYKELKNQNEKLIEFVKDCSVSHNETRYKYRAQALLNEINRSKNSECKGIK